jgi:hypothetical protein
MSAQVRALRALLAEQFPDATPLAERDALRLARQVATGIGALDAVLPGGGLPRGKLTAWAPAGGSTAVLRAACRAVLAGGERAAWVDAARTRPLGARWESALHAPDHPSDAPLVVHPAGRVSALRSAELLLHSGAFALVVLEPATGAEPQGTEVVRLARAARGGGSAFVALTAGGAMAALRVTSRLDARGIRWRHGPFGDPAAAVSARVSVRVRAAGWNAAADFLLPVAPYDLRCALDPHAPDRRAAAPRDDQ